MTIEQQLAEARQAVERDTLLRIEGHLAGAKRAMDRARIAAVVILFAPVVVPVVLIMLATEPAATILALLIIASGTWAIMKLMRWLRIL